MHDIMGQTAAGTINFQRALVGPVTDNGVVGTVLGPHGCGTSGIPRFLWAGWSPSYRQPGPGLPADSLLRSPGCCDGAPAVSGRYPAPRTGRWHNRPSCTNSSRGRVIWPNQRQCAGFAPCRGPVLHPGNHDPPSIGSNKGLGGIEIQAVIHRLDRLAVKSSPS